LPTLPITTPTTISNNNTSPVNTALPPASNISDTGTSPTNSTPSVGSTGSESSVPASSN
jgi:hypothetical protein